MRRIPFWIFFLFFSGLASAATVDIRLELKSGQRAIPGGTVEAWVYTANVGFVPGSDLLVWETGDVVNLKVVNTLPEAHGFVIEGLLDLGLIAPGDSAQQQIISTGTGIYRYFDPVNAPYNTYMGLAGIVHIKTPGDPVSYFYWNISEQEKDWNTAIPSGATPLLSDYDPDLFFINGNYNPYINQDPVARVNGNVGSEFRVIMVNNGISTHSMHFHGYHLMVIASGQTQMMNRSKDTFPLKQGNYMMLSCTPDKPGEYPVHDHNLVAVTGNGMYPNGMFTSLLINP